MTGGACAAVLALGLWGTGTEADSEHEVGAASAVATMSVHCVVPASVVFVPAVTYAILPRTSAAMLPGCHSQLHGAVNGQEAVDSDCTWINPQNLVIHHSTPVMKLAGQQCKTTTAAELRVRRAHRTPMEEVALTAHGLAHSNAHFLDEHSVTLFGGNGKIAAAPLQDGRDHDRLQNGEIAFGGETPATGGSQTTLYLTDFSTPRVISPQLHFEFIAR